MRVNQIDEAIKALQQALTLDSQSAAAYRMLGYCQVQQNKKRKDWQIFRRRRNWEIP